MRLSEAIDAGTGAPVDHQAGWLRTDEGAEGLILVLGGVWDVSSVGDLDRSLVKYKPPRKAPIALDMAAIERLDTAGAWVLHRTARRLRGEGYETSFRGAKPDHRALLDRVVASDRPEPVHPVQPGLVVATVARIGAGTVEAAAEAGRLLSFLGLVLTVLLRSLVMPQRLRLTSLFHHMETVGFNALPIVGLISFLIGIVLAYQGATQLRQFGAEVFVVDLIGVSILRELGILLTAIIIAGRSGSAFTAQIGSMKVNEEIDAMRTLGLDPIEILVLPRILALVITLPLLAFFADMMGLLGGGLMSWLVLGISPALFIERLNDAVGFWTFGIGILKAPFFAFLIALVGCFEGMRVSGSAESVGRLTTRSVVESIFLVIVADAAFSIFFATIGV